MSCPGRGRKAAPGGAARRASRLRRPSGQVFVLSEFSNARASGRGDDGEIPRNPGRQQTCTMRISGKCKVPLVRFPRRVGRFHEVRLGKDRKVIFCDEFRRYFGGLISTGMVQELFEKARKPRFPGTWRVISVQLGPEVGPAKDRRHTAQQMDSSRKPGDPRLSSGSSYFRARRLWVRRDG